MLHIIHISKKKIAGEDVLFQEKVFSNLLNYLCEISKTKIVCAQVAVVNGVRNCLMKPKL